ncbi:MAG: restriction endonuclease subunit S [Chloroflexota bacterium]
MKVDNWQETTLGDFVTLQRGHDLPDQERRSGKVPIIGSAGITGYHDTAIAKGPGVTVGRSGASFGVVTYSPVDYWPHNACLYVIDFHGNDERFAYYYLKSLDFSSFNSGSAQPSLNRNFIHPIKIIIPPIPEQRAIAGILGALDDKIELNRRMNRTLESMARAVFAEMMNASREGGRMEVEKLGDICEFAYGKGLKEDERQAGSIPVYGSNGQIGWHNEYLVKGPGIVVGRKGNPGIVTWAQNDFFPIDTTFYVVPKEPKTSLYWLYYTLTSLNLPDLGADSAVPGLNRNIAYMSDVDYPTEDLMNKFDAFVMPIFNRIDANEKESRTLASLRDSLLPKLMKGEVRVRGL